MLKQMGYNFYSFYQTWVLLDEKVNLFPVNDYTIPWIVNGAFACEIGIKYILLQNQVEYKKEHLLHELFNLLPDTHKIEILSDLALKYPECSWEQFNQEILLLSDAFCNFRYFYEHTLTFNPDFCKTWFQAIFRQVNKYPSYKVVQRFSEPDISMEELDEKILNAQNDMLERLKKKR